MTGPVPFASLPRGGVEAKVPQHSGELFERGMVAVLKAAPAGMPGAPAKESDLRGRSGLGVCHTALGDHLVAKENPVGKCGRHRLAGSQAVEPAQLHGHDHHPGGTGDRFG